MLKIRRKSKKAEKVNVIPILDAVFIFIFFLLMSAQFLEIYEISSDAPTTSLVDLEDKKQKPPLNLTMEILQDKVVLKKGAEKKLHKVIKNLKDELDKDSINKELISLKKAYIDEGTITFIPEKKIKYQKLIELIDIVSRVYADQEPLVGIGKDGKLIETRKLFETVMFEDMEE